MLYRQIILEWGQDTESGVWGLGYSPDNGKNFYVLNTTHGRKYRAEDGNRLYPYISDQIQDKIDTVVAPAKSAADSAYSMASQAVEQAEVTKQAQAETAEALNEAKVGANEAASRAVSAMDEAKRIGTLLDDNQKDIDEQNKSLEDLRGQVTILNSASTKITSDVSQARTDLATEKARLDQVAEQAATNSTNIATYKATNDGLSAQLATTQGDVADLQANATKLQSSMTNAQSDISLLKQTASGIQTDVANTKSDISQIDQKADSIKSTVSGLSTDVTGLKSSTSQLTTQLAQTNSSVSITAQKADNAVSTANSANDKASAAASDVAQIKVTADGVTTIAKNAQSDATLAEQTATEAKTTATNASGDATVAKQTASEAKTTATNAQSGVSILQQTALNISSRVSSVENSVKTQIISSAIDLNTLTTRGLYSIQTTSQTNSPASNWAMVSVQGNADDGTRLYQSWWADADSTKIYYRSRLGGTWTAWSTKADTSDITALQAKITSNSTAIDQNKKSIALKADQTTVDTLSGKVSQNTATLTTQANLISSKVTSSDVQNLLNSGGYATQTYTQSLVTQKADQWNLNLTSLQTEVNAIDVTGGGVNLQSGTSDDSGAKSWTSTTYALYDQFRFNFEKGKTYTFSYDVICNATPPKNLTIGVDIFAPTGGSDWTNSSGFWDLHTVNQGTTHVESTFTITDNWTKWGIWRKPNADTTSLTITNVKLERGSVATPYSPAPSDMATVTSVTNLSATVDGIKSTVATKADQSTVTQLSNLVQDKVSSGDFTSTTTQLKNLINQRVQVGDVISQINQEAGGDTLIQVSNGKKSLILDAANTIITGKAWIPSAAIANITADQVQAGTLSGSKVHAGDNSGNAIDMGALSTDYVGFHAYANNGDNTYIDLNGIHNYGNSYDTRIKQGKITTDYLAVNGGGMIDFRDSNGTGMVADGSTLTFDVNNSPAGYLSYNGMPVAEIPDGSGGNELQIRYGLSTAIIPGDNSGAQATFSKAAQKIAYMTGTSQGKQMLSGLEVHSNNHHWLGAVNSDATYNRIEINSNDGVNLTWHDNTHFWVSDGKAKLYKDYDDGQTATKLEVHGWAWVNGWVEAAGHSQHSTLSSKTRIEEADPDHMLDLVNNTDLMTFAFKSEVAEGIEIRHIGPIIDDVNDVAQYRTPAEFIAPTKTARDDDNMIGALFGAVQALTKWIKKMEDKLNG